MKKFFLTVCALLVCTAASRAQRSVNVLFVGNSYTEVNNLPQMVQQVAASTGCTLTWQSNTPGGCTFSQHCTNNSMTLIRNGGWDIVVLQEQSQYPSFPQSQVEAEVFPYAERLVDSIYAHSPCCEPMFYMTWGRKNGDAGNAPYFPILGTYEGMDSMLCERYTYMAQSNDASLCPVGRVWRYLRENYDDIELYQSDGSHPSVAGSYAAACAFYVLFFHRDPDAITYDASLPENTARTIRAAVHTVVYENLSQWQRPLPQASFELQMIDDSTASFTSASLHADSLAWDFGDGNGMTTPSDQNRVSHIYAAPGDYTATLTASRHCMADTLSLTVHIVRDTVPEPPDTTVRINPAAGSTLSVYPNPAADKLNISLPNPAPKVTATLYSLDGRMVLQRTVPTHGDGQMQTCLTVDGVKTGEYLLHVKTPGDTFVRRIIILR